MGSLIEGYSIEDVFFKKSDKTNTLDKDLNLMFSVPLGRIKTNKEQPRKVFNEKTLNELAQSIKAQGILQPILVEEIADNMFSIVAGERRFKAAEIAGLSEVPVIVKKFNDTTRLEVALIENIQREDLNPIEEATAYSFLLQQTQITQEELAEKLEIGRAHV